METYPPFLYFDFFGGGFLGPCGCFGSEPRAKQRPLPPDAFSGSVPAGGIHRLRLRQTNSPACRECPTGHITRLSIPSLLLTQNDHSGSFDFLPRG